MEAGAGGDHLPEERAGDLVYAFYELQDLVSGPGVVLREAVGERGEAEVWVAGEAVGGVGEGGEAAVDVVGVEEGNVDGVEAENLGEFEHGVHRALKW